MFFEHELPMSKWHVLMKSGWAEHQIHSTKDNNLSINVCFKILPECGFPLNSLINGRSDFSDSTLQIHWKLQIKTNKINNCHYKLRNDYTLRYQIQFFNGINLMFDPVETTTLLKLSNMYNARIKISW